MFTWAVFRVAGLGAWSFAKDVWKLLPPKVWAILGLVLVAIFYHLATVHAARVGGKNEGIKEATAKCAAAEKARVTAQAAANKAAQAKLDAAQQRLVQQQIDHQEELAAREKANAAALADAKGRMPAYVSTLRLPATDTPRGYLLWRSAAAAFANGADLPAAPDASAGPLDGPSGVPLATLAETDLAQAAAFRDAITWGTGWQKYAFDVKQSCEQTLSILKGTP